MATQLEPRQGIRKALIITSLLLFPMIMNYLSPYVIIDGASQGIVNGMVQVGAMEHGECIMCGTCVDVCPKDMIRYSFSRGK